MFYLNLGRKFRISTFLVFQIIFQLLFYLYSFPIYPYIFPFSYFSIALPFFILHSTFDFTFTL
ncbi:hypothetical protein BZA77DRAFT_300270 [Pyronema omphalodes]|nr:hypothetical protein BZA77DRAFT_300270 [Pyronema omphalodes]